MHYRAPCYASLSAADTIETRPRACNLSVHIHQRSGSISSIMPATRKGGGEFKYYNSKKNPLNAPTTQRYVEYSTTSLGGIATTSSNIQVSRMETVTKGMEDEPMDVDSSENPDPGVPVTNQHDNGDLDELPIDQAYIQHLQEEGEPEEEVLKRVRPKGVRWLKSSAF